MTLYILLICFSVSLTLCGFVLILFLQEAEDEREAWTQEKKKEVKREKKDF